MKFVCAVLLGLFALSSSGVVFAEGTANSSDIETARAESGAGDLQISTEFSPFLGATPKGSTRLELATLNISASCESDITISGLELMHTGLGESSDISAVYVMNGFRRISRSRTFDRRSHIADLRFTSFVVHACEAIRVKVLVDISEDATVASEHGIAIAHATSIHSTAKNTTLVRSDSTMHSFTAPTDAGSITVNFLPIKGPLRYGRQETVARVQLTADAKNDHLLQSITFINLGDARDMNLIDFTLENRRGEIFSPLAQRMRGLTVTLEFDPTYILERGKTVVFLLKATIHSSQSKTVNFTVEEPSDIHSVPYRPSRS